MKEKYHGKPNKNFKKDVKRLIAGEPLDYVIGFTEFLGCRIDLSKRPLIPRPETEFWAENAIRTILAFCRTQEYSGRRQIKVLDMFAGSGCVGLAVLRHVKNSHVTFADSSAKCLKQIKINLKANQFYIRANKKTWRVVKSDIFSKIKNKYDFILANPPYIPTKNKNKIQKSVLKYEPKKALFGGKDGLFFIYKFLEQAKSRLNIGGKIFMEFDPPQKGKIEKLLKKYKYAKWEFKKDQYGKWRWLVIE